MNLTSLFNRLARRIRYAQIVRNRRNARLDAAFYASLPRPAIKRPAQVIEMPVRPAAAPATRRAA